MSDKTSVAWCHTVIIIIKIRNKKKKLNKASAGRTTRDIVTLKIMSFNIFIGKLEEKKAKVNGKNVEEKFKVSLTNFFLVFPKKLEQTTYFWLNGQLISSYDFHLKFSQPSFNFKL